MTTTDPRSGCPINLAVEILGDRWSLVVLRDMIFGNRRSYGELHGQSLEKIATNILASRLKRLVAVGLISGADDPAHSQRTIYSLTEQAIALVPVIVQMSIWGAHWLDATPELAARALALEAGGAEMTAALQAELRHLHLGAPAPDRSVLAELGTVYAKAAAQAGARPA